MNVKRARPSPRSEERKERLVAAAYQTIRANGLANLRTRDVAAEAHITVATLHYYFPTKDDLVRAVIEHAITAQMLVPLALEEDRADGVAALRTMIDGLRAQAEQDPGHFRLLHDLIWHAHGDPAVHEMLAHWHEGWHATIVGWLQAGQREGRFRPDLRAESVATMVVYLVLGMVTRPPMAQGADAHLGDELERLLSPTRRSEA